MKLLPVRAAGVLADTINDADSTRKVYLLAAGLAVLGIALVVITVWFWRSTRNDPDLLGPLEVLGDRKFRRLEGTEQRQRLDESRPNDAKPLQWGVRRGAAADGPAVIASAHDDALVVEDSEFADSAAGASVAAGGGRAAGGAGPDAAADPAADLDSILAAAGAVVPGRAALARAASIGPEPVEPADVASAAADPLAVLGISPTAVAEPSSDAASRIVDASEPSVAGEPIASGPAANAAGDARPLAQTIAGLPGERAGAPASAASAAELAPKPLLIVPVDHDLRPSVGRPVDPLKPLEPLRARRPASGSGRAEAAADHDIDRDAADAFEGSDEFDERDVLTGPGEHYAEDGDVDDDVDATASIDPLLRMFNRNDT